MRHWFWRAWNFGSDGLPPRPGTSLLEVIFCQNAPVHVANCRFVEVSRGYGPSLTAFASPYVEVAGSSVYLGNSLSDLLRLEKARDENLFVSAKIW